jgi:hypothetical protein
MAKIEKKTKRCPWRSTRAISATDPRILKILRSQIRALIGDCEMARRDRWAANFFAEREWWRQIS